MTCSQGEGWGGRMWKEVGERKEKEVGECGRRGCMWKEVGERGRRGCMWARARMTCGQEGWGKRGGRRWVRGRGRMTVREGTTEGMLLLL